MAAVSLRTGKPGRLKTGILSKRAPEGKQISAAAMRTDVRAWLARKRGRGLARRARCQYNGDSRIRVCEEENLPKYYPLCLDIRGKRCLVVGGGKVALRKALDLLEAGAKVKAVAPKFAGAFRKTRGIELCRKAYDSSDLRDCALAIAATNSKEVNRRVCADARREGILVNVVDTPEMCDFIVPATLRRGEMTISVSTGNASPSLARKIRRELEKRYPAKYAAYVRLLGEIRRTVKEKFPAHRRRQIMEQIVNGRAWAVLAKKGVGEARRYVRNQVKGQRSK